MNLLILYFKMSVSFQIILFGFHRRANASLEHIFVLVSMVQSLEILMGMSLFTKSS